jgi:small-conductance mechanosensitive channel
VNFLEDNRDDLIYIGIFIGIVIATFIVAAVFNRFFKRYLDRSSAELMNDPTNYKFLRHVLTGAIYMTGFGVAIYSMPGLRTLAGSILAGAGILAVAVGFASQHALSNIVSGVFMIIFKPFRINDRIRLREWSGLIEDITLRHTVIRDFENRRIIIPNSVISDEVIINSDFGDDKVCKHVEFGISYESDVDLAKKIIREEVENHPSHIDGRTQEEKAANEPVIMIKVMELGDFAVKIRAWAWAVNSAAAFEMNCDLLESVKKRFKEAGIEIPYPHRTLVYKTPKEETE